MSKKLPTISVVIPAYNEALYLPHCLKALTAQTYPKENYNIIVVDNNSTDDTAEIAQRFGATVIREHRQGHVYSLNAGLHAATGEIIAVTDADTIVSKTWLSDIATAFEDQKLVGLTGSNSLDLDSPTMKFIFEKLYNLFLRINFSLNKPHFAGPNMALRKSAFLALKNVDLRYTISGDVEIGMRLRHIGKVKFFKNITAVTSSRRFKRDFPSLLKDIYKYARAYIYAIWLVKPPQESLVPVRERNK